MNLPGTAVPIVVECSLIILSIIRCQSNQLCCSWVLCLPFVSLFVDVLEFCILFPGDGTQSLARVGVASSVFLGWSVAYVSWVYQGVLYFCFYWYALKLLSLFWSRWSRWSCCARCPRWNSVSCGIVKAVRYEGIWSDHHEDVFFVLFCIVFCLGEMFTDRALEEGGGGRMCPFFVPDWVCWHDEEVVCFVFSVRPSVFPPMFVS